MNADTGRPVYLGEDGERLLSMDFKKAKLSEILGRQNGDEAAKSRRELYSARHEFLSKRHNFFGVRHEFL